MAPNILQHCEVKTVKRFYENMVIFFFFLSGEFQKRCC